MLWLWQTRNYYTVRFNDLEAEEIITQIGIKPWKILRDEYTLRGYGANLPSINGRSAVTVYTGSEGND